MKVFISYARSDTDFTDKLAGSLIRNGIEVQIDRTDLTALSDWRKQLRKLMRGCDIVICVLSPQWASSETCKWEMQQALSQGKRLAPIRYKDLDKTVIPAELKPIQWALFTSPEKFDEELARLVKALETDGEWAQFHTRFQDLAERWDELKRPDTHLLDGEELSKALVWYFARPPGGASVTPLHKEFIRRSRSVNGWVAKSIREIATELIATSGKSAGSFLAFFGGLALLAVALVGILRSLFDPLVRAGLVFPRATALCAAVAAAGFFGSSAMPDVARIADQTAMSIGLREPPDDPLNSVEWRLRSSVGLIRKGVVRCINSSGAFVEIEPKLIGLVDNQIWNGRKDLAAGVGEPVNVRLLVAERLGGRERFGFARQDSCTQRWRSVDFYISLGLL